MRSSGEGASSPFRPPPLFYYIDLCTYCNCRFYRKVTDWTKGVPAVRMAGVEPHESGSIIFSSIYIFINPHMLSYNEITPKKYIDLEGEPFEVLTSWVFRKQMRKPVNQTKLRSLKTGNTVEYTFHQNDKVKEAEIEEKPVRYLYQNKGEYWFCDPTDPKNRFELSQKIVGDLAKYMKQNSEVEGLWYAGEIIGISVPIKVDLKVVEAPPALKGNTAQGGNKQVVVETGASFATPLFINEGDIIRVNTTTGEYAERVDKA